MKPPQIGWIGILLSVLVFAAITCVSARTQTNTSANAAPKPAAAATGSAKSTPAKTPASPAAKPVSAAAGSPDAKALGSKSAPITIEVFEDFQCPACRNFYETSLKQVIDNYVTPGKVYLIHRDFPLEMHPYSRQAARLANAAADLGQLASTVSAAQMKKIRDYQSAHINDINAAIERDRTMGVKRNVNQTPSIYVTSHGKTEALPGGGVNYDLLRNYLDYLLRQ